MNLARAKTKSKQIFKKNINMANMTQHIVIKNKYFC